MNKPIEPICYDCESLRQEWEHCKSRYEIRYADELLDGQPVVIECTGFKQYVEPVAILESEK